MKIIGSIVGVYTALLLAVPTVLADETSGQSMESLDSALQKLGSSSSAPATRSELPALAPAPVAASPSVTAASYVASPPPAPPVAVNTPSRGMKVAPAGYSRPVQTASETTPVLWVYDFSANWCPSCRKLAPVVEEAATKYEGFIKYVPVNVDKNQDLVRKLNIAQIPTVMVVDRSGRTLNRLVGLQQGVQIEMILDHYKAQTMAALDGTH